MMAKRPTLNPDAPAWSTDDNFNRSVYVDPYRQPPARRPARFPENVSTPNTLLNPPLPPGAPR